MKFSRSARQVIAQVTVITVVALTALASGATANAEETADLRLSPFGAYLAARHAQISQHYSDAAHFMDQALTADPDNPELLSADVALRVGAGDFAGAVPLAQRIVAGQGNAGLAAFVVLVDDIKTGKFDAATKLAQTMPREGVERYAVPLLLAWSEMGQKQTDPALKALDPLNAMRELAPLKDLHTALINDQAGRADAAGVAYEELLADEPQPTWRVVELVSNFYARQGRRDEARKLYESYAALDTDSAAVDTALAQLATGAKPPPLIATPAEGAAEGLFDFASLLNERQTLDAALLYARLCLELDPHFELAKLLAGEIRAEQGQTEAALTFFRAVDPGSTLAWSARLRAALALDDLGRTDEATAALQKMVAEQPHSADALIELGDIQRAHNHFPQAVQAYDQAIARLPAGKVSWHLYYSRGVALERSGQWPPAEADLKHALALQPNQPLVLNYLGYSWIERGENLPQALRMVSHAVDLQPTDGYIVDSLGWAYYRLGDIPRATMLLEHATELLPEDATINDHLGDAYWRAGRYLEARYQWQYALRFGPEAAETKELQTKLDHGMAKPSKMSGG